MTITISDSEIHWAESILLPSGSKFDNERCEVIRCLDTKDIQACPGSGKTTALLAKLLILSRKMPFENNRGICVLTHTNVAINEIKKRASVYASKLFGYPNHFGTIQSFVDKYLAIPAYINNFNRRPLFINNEIYFDRMERLRRYLGRETIAFCLRSGLKNYPYSIQFEDFKLDNNICCKLNLNTNDPPQKKIYDKLLGMKKKILADGILRYEDAYYIAKYYIKKFPNLKDLFSKRFMYIFVDEMQDSYTTQSELLNNFFHGNVIFQKFGDLNQSIFESNQECGWSINESCSLCITGSKRFTNSIASKVQSLCVSPQSITGNERQNEINPVIIVYDANNIQQVLNKYGEIIIRNNLHQVENNKFKAVGWVGKLHESKITIPSYWKDFSQEIKFTKTEFCNLKSYLSPRRDIYISSLGVNYYKKRLVDMFLKCLRIVEIPNENKVFTEKKLLRYISENDPVFYNDLRIKLAKWCLQIHEKIDVFEEINNFLNKELRDFFNYQVNNELNNFINSSEIENENEKVLQNNIYKYLSETAEIEIEVSTIHGVKGETHTATCYLETFYHDYDIKRIIKYLKGEYTIPTNVKVKQNLRMSFVGMSRPSHLLCVAARRESISGHEELLQRNGWEINYELCE